MMRLPVLKTTADASTKSALRSVLLRLYRTGILSAIVLLLHVHSARLRIDGDAPITVEEARQFFPSASTFTTDTSERMGLFFYDSSGKQVGYLLRTAPLTDHITGFSGPTDTLIALNNDMVVIGIRIRSSMDTKQHVRDVASDKYFLRTWTGKTWEQVAGMNPKDAHIEGVSGASLTSMCIANGIQQRFKFSYEKIIRKPQLQVRLADVGLMLVIATALLLSFTKLRSSTLFRRIFQIILIGYVGLYNGQLLSMSLLSGWAANQLPWQIAPGLTVLAAVALLTPIISRRATYCSHICPHGAAQELLGKITRRRLRIPAALEAAIRWLPPLLIGVVLFASFHRLPFDLSAIEPFDAYLIKAAGASTIAIAIVGLVLSLFIPMAYCKLGCPTGWLLSFVRSHGNADRFGTRDLAGLGLFIFTVALYKSHAIMSHWIFR